MSKYEYRSDGNSGAIQINTETGEVTDAIALHGPPGSILLTPQQMEYSRKKKAEKEAARNKEINHLLHMVYKRKQTEKYYVYHEIDAAWEGISPANIARCIYLGTYIQYDGNTLLLSERSKLKKKDLSQVLEIASSSIGRFWEEVNGKIFTADKDGTLHVCGNLFVRGSIQATANREYQRIYLDAMRSLYMRTNSRDHAKLGKVFSMLPYINFEYNILCKNPAEKNCDRIEPLTVSDFCSMVGYAAGHAARTITDYNKITFTVNGVEELFCKFLGDGKNILNHTIYINPEVLYKGSDYSKVEGLGISFLPTNLPHHRHLRENTNSTEM